MTRPLCLTFGFVYYNRSCCCCCCGCTCTGSGQGSACLPSLTLSLLSFALFSFRFFFPFFLAASQCYSTHSHTLTRVTVLATCERQSGWRTACCHEALSQFVCKLKLKLSAQCNVVPADNNIAERGVRCRRRRGLSALWQSAVLSHYVQLSLDEVTKEASSAAAESFCPLSQVTVRACKASDTSQKLFLGK